MENELLRNMSNGDQHALTIIYQRYWENLYKIALHIVKDEETAEDVIHDVFVNIWTCRKKLQIKTSLGSYLQSSVKYKCFEKLRRSKRNVHVELTEETSNLSIYNHCTIEFNELQSKLDAIIDAMPIKSKHIFRLSRDENMSYFEISKKMNLSVKSIEYHISKVIRQLRSEFPFLTIVYAVILWSKDIYMFFS